MSTVQLGALNAEILRNLGIVAENEGALQRVAKYLRRVARELAADPTELTKDEFLRRVDAGREQIRRGEGVKMHSDESLEEFLKRVG
ncbi:MAG: hypothetical protein IJQ44_00220 [Bacteroidaceae bacterium]|nr:hypothetical protein [Bacteroidaceae bacterium]